VGVPQSTGRSHHAICFCMTQHSKRFVESAKKVDAKKTYIPDEAIKLAKETSTVKFDASVEVHARLGIDPKKGEQQVRATVTLPHGTGKTARICAFVANDADAKAAGADIVGGEELIAEIKKTEKIDCDVAIATPDMMPKLAAIARVLGPRGLMPSPKNDTVTTDVKKTIEALKKGKIAFKNDGTANVHQIIGKASFTEKQLLENYETFMDAITKAKPSASKGVYIKSVVVTTTMGPGIKVQT